MTPTLRTDPQGLAAFEAAIFGDDRFMRAFKMLAASLSSSRGAHLLGDLTAYLNAVTENRPRCVSTPGAATMTIAFLHLKLGSPLHLSDALFDAWAIGSRDVAECPHCGYRHPASFRICALCGTQTGPAGCWSEALAAAAEEMAVN